ncbi:unnamed protein product, partial [Amoebophrya sp. A120]
GDGHIDGKELQTAVLLGKTLQADHAGGEENAPQLAVEDVQARMKLLHPAKFGSFESDVATAYSSTDEHVDLDGKASAMEIKLAYQMQGERKEMSITTDEDTVRDTVNQYLGSEAIASNAELKTYDFDEDGKISLAELKVIHELRRNHGKFDNRPHSLGGIELLQDLLPETQEAETYWTAFQGLDGHSAGQWSREEILLAVRQAPADDSASDLLTEKAGVDPIGLDEMNTNYRDMIQALQIDGRASDSEHKADDFKMRDLNGDGGIDSRELQ